jgi:hypothetical protein
LNSRSIRSSLLRKRRDKSQLGSHDATYNAFNADTSESRMRNLLRPNRAVTRTRRHMLSPSRVGAARRLPPTSGVATCPLRRELVLRQYSAPVCPLVPSLFYVRPGNPGVVDYGFLDVRPPAPRSGQLIVISAGRIAAQQSLRHVPKRYGSVRSHRLQRCRRCFARGETNSLRDASHAHSEACYLVGTFARSALTCSAVTSLP